MSKGQPLGDDPSTTRRVAACASQLQARCDAAGRFATDDLMFVEQYLGSALTPFTLMSVLRAALGVPVELLRAVENWQAASDTGDMSTGEVAALLDRWWATSRGGAR